jgi:putative FmdB family regulatory protein
MPTYEYTCRDCGHTFDIVQKMADDSLTICPRCGGRLRKVFAAPAIAFKGSGFYATDHGKGSKGRDDAKDAPAGAKADSKDTKDTKKDAGSSEKKTGDTSTKKKESSSGTAAPSKEGSGS